MTSHKRRPAPPGQRPAGFTPAATLQEAEARAIPPQPEGLRRWREAQQPQEPPGHASHVVNGMTGESFATEDAEEGLPRRKARRGRRRPWCSLCTRYLTQKEATGHTHEPPVPPARRKKTTRKQNWRWQGLAGRERA